MNNIYQPPASDVTVRSSLSPEGIFIFQRFSTWYVLALSIITLNLYAIYWLHTRTSKLNEVVDEKISAVFCRSTLIIYCFSFLFYGYVHFIHPPNEHLELASSVIDQTAKILYLVWVYKFRNRLKRNFFNEDVHIGAIAPFFFLHLFLQYKLNELLDNTRHNKGAWPNQPAAGS